MKKKIIIASIMIILIFSGFIAESIKISADVRDQETEKTGNDFIGTWYLSPDNDFSAMDEVFPDIYAFGNELTIRPDGKIYWHIGAAGAAGTYEVYGNQLSACVADIMEYDEYRIAFTMDDEGSLNMTYKSVQLKWDCCSGMYQSY